jgi:hypothetical protein
VTRDRVVGRSILSDQVGLEKKTSITKFLEVPSYNETLFVLVAFVFEMVKATVSLAFTHI